MNESLKQNRLLGEHGDDRSFLYSSNDRNIGSDHQKNVRSCILVFVSFPLFSGQVDEFSLMMFLDKCMLCPSIMSKCPKRTKGSSLPLTCDLLRYRKQGGARRESYGYKRPWEARLQCSTFVNNEDDEDDVFSDAIDLFNRYARGFQQCEWVSEFKLRDRGV